MMYLLETVFDLSYLILVVSLGSWMLTKAGRSGDPKQYRLLGLMAVVLGCGDAFHLVPRVYSMWSPGGFEANTAALGMGQAVTSVTMTAFYVMLYWAWRERYGVEGAKSLNTGVICLAAARVLLCLAPQNQWTSPDAPLSWGIWRNIPFAILGVLVAVLFWNSAKLREEQGEKDAFRWMWLAIAVSFGCYIPVVLFSNAVPAVGALMLPKTAAYVWMVWMGFGELKSVLKEKGVLQ